jgi:hypothetical protein
MGSTARALLTHRTDEILPDFGAWRANWSLHQDSTLAGVHYLELPEMLGHRSVGERRMLRRR